MAQFIDRELVDWFFQNRLQAAFDVGYTNEQSAANDRTWAYICEHNRHPSDEWLAANNAKAIAIKGKGKGNPPRS